MKKFSMMHVPVLCFFSKELYADVGLRWRGVNFLYLLLLLAICWVPMMMVAQEGISDIVNNEAPAFVEQLPEITIADGNASIVEDQPYYIITPEDGDVLAIIDTTGEIESLEDSNARCLLTETKVMWKKSEIETQIMELSQIEHFVLNKERVLGWLNNVNKFFVLAMYPFALFGSYVVRIVQALIYAAVGLMFASKCKVVLSYGSLVRLAVVAMTPCMLVKTIFVAAGVYPPYSTLLYLLVTLAYLFFGVKANADMVEIVEDGEDLEGTIV